MGMSRMAYYRAASLAAGASGIDIGHELARGFTGEQ